MKKLHLSGVFNDGINNKNDSDLNTLIDQMDKFIINEKRLNPTFILNKASISKIYDRKMSIESNKKSCLYVELEHDGKKGNYIFKTFVIYNIKEEEIYNEFIRETFVQYIANILMIDFIKYYKGKTNIDLDIHVLRTFFMEYNEPIHTDLVGFKYKNKYYYQVEKSLSSFKKYTNNFAYIDSKTYEHIFHTFSHFTFVYTGCSAICVDLQGDDKNLTDIQFNTMGKTLTKCDMGVTGVYTAIALHDCNAHCEKLRLPNIYNTNNDDELYASLLDSWNELRILGGAEEVNNSFGIEERQILNNMGNFAKNYKRLEVFKQKYISRLTQNYNKERMTETLRKIKLE